MKKKKDIKFLKNFLEISKKTKDVRISILLDFLFYEWENREKIYSEHIIDDFIPIDFSKIELVLFVKRKTIDKFLKVLSDCGFITIKKIEKRNYYKINKKEINNILTKDNSFGFLKAPITLNNILKDVRVSLLAHKIYYKWDNRVKGKSYVMIESEILENTLFVKRKTIYRFVKKLKEIGFIKTQKRRSGKYYKVNVVMAKRYFS